MIEHLNITTVNKINANSVVQQFRITTSQRRIKMNEAQRNELKLKVTQHTGYAMYHMATGDLVEAKYGLIGAKERLQELINEERDRTERREHENATMRDDEKSENATMRDDEKSEE